MIAACTTQFWRSRHQRRRPAAFVAALVVFIIVILVAAPQAQPPQAFTPNGPGSTPIRDASSGSEIDLLVGRSTVLNVGSTIARVSLTVPDIADAMVTAPSQLLIHGKQPGTISLFVWDKAGTIRTYEVTVRRDLLSLKEHLKQLFPGEDITVIGSGKDVVLSGTVASKYVVEKAAEVAAGYVEKKDNVVNLVKQQEGVASNQVMLRVRFAEVSRSALQELGVTFFANGYKSEWFGRSAPPGVPSPDFDNEKGLVFSDFLNLFVFNSKEGLGAAVKALQTKGLFQSLAEPNLIATNGKEASFLAGGEYPYPVVQSGSNSNSISIQFKEFGVRLNFTPTVLGGDLINLKVRPEVSSLDFSNAVILDGFRVPALATRRTETEVELRDGQTFAIAGLMNNTLTNSMSKIPGIGDIPILGLLFRSKAHQKNQTELVVMITPSIIRRGQMGVSEGLPSLVEPYLDVPNKRHPNPDPYLGSPRYPVNQSKPAGGDNNAPAPAPQASGSSKSPVPSRAVGQQPNGPTMTPSSRPESSMPAPVPPPDRPASSPMTPTSSPSGAPSPYSPSPSSPYSPPPATPRSPSPTSPAQSSPYSPSPSSPYSSPGSPAASPSPTPATMPMESPARVVPAPGPSKSELRAMEKAREQEKKAEEAEARERAKKDAEEQQAMEVEKRQADKLAKERARREAEIAKKNAELARKKADEDQKREKALTEAAARLKEAQSAYQSELEKAKGGKGTGPGSKQ
jgi:pilus assembly protein CpaC